MTFFRTGIRDAAVTVFGVRGPTNPNFSNPRLKAALKGRYVERATIEAWARRIERLLKTIDDEFLTRQSEMLEPLHDPIRIAKQIELIADTILEKQYPRLSDDSRLEKADRDMKSLIKATRLLRESFELLGIYFNPDAASYGRKSYTSLHGLLVKLTSILRLQDQGNEGVRIFLVGQSFKRVLVFDSFSLVPFALISNAVKYSMEGHVRVEIIERNRAVEVTVESYGPLIEADELPRIFEKKRRGKWGMQVASGTGVGLYLARIVAEANGSEILVSSTPTGRKSTQGIPLATNRFSFELPLGAGS